VVLKVASWVFRVVYIPWKLGGTLGGGVLALHVDENARIAASADHTVMRLRTKEVNGIEIQFQYNRSFYMNLLMGAPRQGTPR
jgi:hypothetical protein